MIFNSLDSVKDYNAHRGEYFLSSFSVKHLKKN